MKTTKLVILLCLFSLLLYACKEDEPMIGNKITNIEFETLSAEIPKEGGIALIASKDTLWGIDGYYEIKNGEKIYIKNEFNVVNQINVSTKDTVTGDWYTLYKKGNILITVLSPNHTDTTRRLWIMCGGWMRHQALITITQK